MDFSARNCCACRGRPISRAIAGTADYDAHVLKQSATVAVATIVFLGGGVTGPARGGGCWETIYVSTNLTNHAVSVECSPGDPTTNCPCSTADVQLAVFEDHGEVTANINQSNFFVNAIGYKRFQDVWPDGKPLSMDILKYSGEIRLPVPPLPTVAQTQNAETAQMMLQLWDGSNRMWEANHTALEATIFWDLNPWRSATFGNIKVYTSTTGSLSLVETGLSLPVDTNWHSLEFTVDFIGGKFVSVVADGVRANVSTIDVARVYRPTWGNEVLYHITQESCSTYPGPGYSNIFWWATEYRNLRLARLRYNTSLADPPVTGNCLNLAWDAEPYVKYQVLTSTDLNAWAPLTNIFVGNTMTQTCSAPLGGAPHAFFRVRVTN
jgi:hypothetical protein